MEVFLMMGSDTKHFEDISSVVENKQLDTEKEQFNLTNQSG